MKMRSTNIIHHCSSRQLSCFDSYQRVYIYERSKHINIIYHHIHNLHLKNKIKIFFVLSADIIVNKLIKFLLKQMFKHFVCQLRLDNSES